MPSKKAELVKVECDKCGGKLRNHKVVAEHSEMEGGTDIYWSDTFQICKCCGCDSVRFRKETYFSADDSLTDETFPEPQQLSSGLIDSRELPERVRRIYNETLIAFAQNAMILAGGGLRAIVEAVCIEQNVRAGSLQDRIDELASTGLLAQNQAALLHEERYLGNTALHEIQPPAKADIADGLEIVETLLKTIYVAPKKAKRLKDEREKRKKLK